MKWVRRVGIGLFVAFFGIACGVVLVFNWSALDFKTLSVPTGSMRPAIPPGSLVLMHRVPVSTIKNGDVITYANIQNVHKTITHRVIKAYQIDGKVPAFITKGDANPSPDPIPVIGGQVLGKTVWYVSHMGSWMSWSKTWIGITILVYLPALIIMVEEIRRLSSYYRSMQLYKIPDYGKTTHNFVFAKVSAVVVIVAGFMVALPAQALLRSNTVALVNNQISVAATKPPSTHCTNSNNVNVSNNSTQTSTSGSSNVNNNTNGGSATSGSASNSNSTSININVNNPCP